MGNVAGNAQAAAEAEQITARFGVEASPHPQLPGRVEVTAPGLVLIGTPDEVTAELARQAQLTAREREVAGLAASGLTSGQVARRLFISERTVHAHLRHVYAKTGTRNRVELVNWLAAHPGPG